VDSKISGNFSLILRGCDVWQRNTFVAVGANGTILTSPDGGTWTLRASLPTNSLYGAAYGNGTFVAVGYRGAILTSPDRVAWTQETTVETSYES
jgi:hypothetical protein